MQKTHFCEKTYFPQHQHQPLLHGMGRVGGAWKHNGHMTTNVFRCLDTGGVSHYPVSHITPLSPTEYA